MTLVLDQVYRLNDVRMVECRRDTEFCGEFLDVFFLSFVFPSFAELLKAKSERLFSPGGTMTRVTDLDGVDLLLGSIPLVHQTNDGGGPLADCTVVADTVLL